jgi:acetyl-CoA carboxylase biotin carboxyl carrier protein
MRHELRSPVTGSVWMHAVGVGQHVYAGTVVLVIECMKMEVPVETAVDGTVAELVEPGAQVLEGDTVAVIESHEASRGTT